MSLLRFAAATRGAAALVRPAALRPVARVSCSGVATAARFSSRSFNAARASPAAFTPAVTTRFSSRSQHQQQQHDRSHSRSESSSGGAASSSSFLDSLRAFLASATVRGAAAGVAVLAVGGGCYLIATSRWQAEMIARLFPEAAAQRDALLHAAQHPHQRSGLMLNPREQQFAYPLVLVGILAVNVVVFAMHQAPRLQGLMHRHFLTSWNHVVGSRLYHTLLTSVFSHSSFMHFGFNMFALMSIAPPVVMIMGQAHFLAFYLAAGLFSSLFQVAGSHFLTRAPFRQLCKSIPSLGASGALMALVGIIGVVFPENRYTLMFVLNNIPAESLVMGLAAFDGAGILYKYVKGPSAGFSLGHAAHFGGLGFGYLYARTVLPAINPQVRRKLAWNKLKAD